MAESKVVYQLTIDHPNAGKGTEFFIQGLGTFENGESYDITEEQADAFRVAGTTYDSEWETDKEGNRTGKQTHTEVLGPTVLQALKDAPGFEVETVEDKPAAAPAKAAPAKEGEK